MKKVFLPLTLAFCLIQVGASCAAPKLSAPQPPTTSVTARDQAFDSSWRFLRADAVGAQTLEFNDSNWRTLDLPHDWSIEDLPPKSNAVPQLPAVVGQWRFQEGDSPDWKARELDDNSWQKVELPDNWEHHSNYTANNVYGWFRRHIEIPADCRGKDFDLLMGYIDDADEVWFNGQRIGGTGSFPPNFVSAWDVARCYRVPVSLVRGDGSDVIAVRVFDGMNNGGINGAGIKTARIGPFSPDESADHHFAGYTVGGTGWYRKHFTVKNPGQLVTVRFDGVYMNAEVWINGHSLGSHPYGYTSFAFDLTPYLKSGENVLAVRVRNEGRNSRWYSGSGIYRHVWLTTTQRIHIPTNGVFITTPEVSTGKALVQISSEVRNESSAAVDVAVRARVGSANGQWGPPVQGQLHLAPGETRPLVQSVSVSAPQLWSPDAPHLYRAQVQIINGSQVIDTVSTRFGIREIQVDAEHGFRINGQPLKLHGGCIHHDNGPLGSAAIDRAEERKVQLLKAAGFNALRCSHNPPSTALLEACDRLGMLVIDEAFDQWNESKENNQQDYHLYFNDWAERDIGSMVRRDRNHPSVVIWSIGNEIPEQLRADATQKRLRSAVLSHDNTRLITQAIYREGGNDAGNWERISAPAFQNLDIVGYNYMPDKYESDHANHPERIMMGTESYPKDAFENWSEVEKHPYVIGDFVWTAMDYFGEAGIAHSVLSNEKDSFFMSWPWYNGWSGDLDVCGFKKPQSYYRDVLWKRSALEMAVHAPIPTGLTENVSGWGWPEETQSWNWAGRKGTPLQVSVYSRCEAVRLELNGRVIGEKQISEASKLTATFEVPYVAGKLSAFGLVAGKVVAVRTLQTTGAPRKLKLVEDRSVIRADRNDLSYVTVEVVDQNGQRVPNAEIPVNFSIGGAGELAAVGSGTPNEPASYRGTMRKTFQGRCLAILRPTGKAGKITLRAEAAGLAPAEVTVRVG